jgi:phosphohistidine phosphatase SixA
MRIFLVRHAHAGSRDDWDQVDHLRPLSPRGWDRANELVDALGSVDLQRLISSPYLRCTQTFGPLAAVLDLPVEDHDALAEGASLATGMALIEELIAADTTVALCSHGDVIPEMLSGLARRGAALDPSGACPKGSIWVLDVAEGAVTAAAYAGNAGLLTA